MTSLTPLCYDEGKRIAETMCTAFKEQDGVQVRIARIFNTFGPRMLVGDGRVVSNFICQALRGLPLTVYGEGSQTRSFQYVGDLVNGLVALMNSNYSLPVNLGNVTYPRTPDIPDIRCPRTPDLIYPRTPKSIIYPTVPFNIPSYPVFDIARVLRDLIYVPRI